MKLACACLLFLTTSVALFAKGDLEEQLQVKRRVDPKYPAIFKEAGIEGEVYVKVYVNEEGLVEKVETIKASNPDFIPATLEAVAQWIFSPATKNGKAIKAEVTIPFRFKLGSDAYKSGYENIFKLKENAIRILRGEKTNELTSFIDSQAYAVINNKFEHLQSLVVDNQKSSLLVEGQETKIEWSRLNPNHTKSSAYLIMKSKPARGEASRLHTIVFDQNVEGNWKLVNWHVSH